MQITEIFFQFDQYWLDNKVFFFRTYNKHNEVNPETYIKVKQLPYSSAYKPGIRPLRGKSSKIENPYISLYLKKI